MTSHDEAPPGEVEWLDLGPAEPPVDPAAKGRRRRAPWYALAVAVLAAGVLVASTRHGTKHPTARSSAPVATTPVSAPTPTEVSPSTTPPVAVTNAGHRLLDVPPGWDLYGIAAGAVVRIELARGRVTRTVTPFLDIGSGLSLVAGPDRVIVRPQDDVPGFEVPDGRPAHGLPAALSRHGSVLPGPDPDHMWVQTASAMSLVGFDGRAPSATIPLTEDVTVASDQAGYVLFYGTGGVYDARPDGTHRITTGELLAAGPTRWLAHECDDRYRCQTTVTDRATGARHAIPTPAGSFTNGVIAPDGSTAALIMVGADSETLHLIDLSSGADHAPQVSFDPQQAFGGGQVVWSPDSRWLFITADEGRLLVLDRRTLNTTSLGVALPPLNQLTLRTGSH